MIQFRRDSLTKIAQPPAEAHAGLWLDKFFPGDDAQTAKAEHVKQVTKVSIPEAYTTFFRRWNQTLTSLGADCRPFRTEGRLAVNLGAEGVLETSIALHRTYGMPYIPGSALKGLAAHFVTEYFKDDPVWDVETRRYLFGDTTSAGYVTFYDALYMPGTGKGLVPDIITVHHPEYYQGAKPIYSQTLELAPPADWDSPTPIPFITVNGTFLLALSGPSDWVKAAFEVLELALVREGVGAKTSSGYGRMEEAEIKIEYKTFKDASEIHIGDYFRGAVSEVEAKGINLSIPELNPDDAQAYVAVDHPGRYQEGAVVRCKVVDIQTIGTYLRVICQLAKAK